jgi:ABC-2 type transport system ATP-binding protein
MSIPVLEVQDVQKQYGHSVALRGVSMAVQPGELFGLLGPNGAGKTTLLSIVSGLLAPTHGTVQIDGQRLGMTDRELRRKIGFATQDLAIYPELTARENLEFFGRLYGLKGDLLNNRVTMLLDSVALSDRANQRCGTYSGGMKRRLNLAVALVHDPNLLLLDEPTTGVDPQSRRHIFEQVRERNRAGLTVIYTSHYMEEVQELCTRIAIVDHGKLVACDTLDHLLGRLDSTAKLDVENASDTLVSQLQTWPELTAVQLDGITLTVSGPKLPTVLAKLLTAVGSVRSVEVTPPTLERVFLSLTGNTLRD